MGRAAEPALVLLDDWAAAVGEDEEDECNAAAMLESIEGSDEAASCDDVRFSMSSSDSDADDDREAPDDDEKAAASTDDSGASGARETEAANAAGAARGGRRADPFAAIDEYK